MFKDRSPIHSRLAHFKGAPGTLHQLLIGHLKKHGPDALAWLIRFGAVYVNKARERDPERLLTAEDIVRVHLEPKRYRFKPEVLEGRVVELNDHFVVVDKPSGVPMHTTVDNADENLLRLLEARVGGHAFVTHRLDIPTSGLVVVARTKDYQSRFNKLIMKMGLHKRYRALTLTEPKEGPYQHWMMPALRAPRILSGGAKEGWDECRLRVLETRAVLFNQSERPGFESFIELETGRTHQIRAQLSFEGHSIVGDPDYGGEEWENFGLRAVELGFRCPILRRDFFWKVGCQWP